MSLDPLDNQQQIPVPTIYVSGKWDRETLSERSFTTSFSIGRDPSSDIHISDPMVSRHHGKVVLENGRWWIQDCNSANHIYIAGKLIQRKEITGQVQVFLGNNGPLLHLRVDSPSHSRSVDYYQDRYFGELDDEEAGEHTIMVRKAFAQVQKKQKRNFGTVIGLLLVLVVLAGSVVFYKQQQLNKQKELAEKMFYSMKEMEIQFASVLQKARETGDRDAMAKVSQYKQKAKELENSYSDFVDSLGSYSKSSPQEQAILKTARIFGECELLVPAEFTNEVLRYIKKWQSTTRLTSALERAEENNYIVPIAGTLHYYSLPQQFFYLALQESNFKTDAIGPKTRWGIAKGMWQFIPETGQRYGLHTGPLVSTRKVDPEDDRHNFAKSTVAAAKYLRKIYDTDAQASGLLVMASYNWGENRVIRMIRAMPNNPQERNFWKFFKQYKEKMPQQTYDYVFSIFAAAVIGENPQLFGFTFENPLLAVQ